MREQIKTLRTEIEHFRANNQEELTAFRQRFMGKKGAITILFAELKKADLEKKKP